MAYNLPSNIVRYYVRKEKLIILAKVTGDNDWYDSFSLTVKFNNVTLQRVLDISIHSIKGYLSLQNSNEINSFHYR